ncbi:MAG: 2-C-methyl-D-erythritol 2,4-cyclodiphosphate synthase [Chthoniobacterales bacterium]|nr:2-C-methyl-D-erythritol 2,4-cyclodiphosphate synthase [Chthoniobacterales bacterium]
MIRTGIGYDVHRFELGRPLILGGVSIPHPDGMGLAGHSDADVLCHAIADAILGAAGKRDIGYYFPNTDPAIAGISSLKILEKAIQLLSEDQMRLVNIDATLIAEQPMINPHIEEMKKKIAQALHLDVSFIGIKATTNEGLGFLGRGEGIAAMAVASVQVMGNE